MKKLIVEFKPSSFEDLAKVLKVIHTLVGNQVENFRIIEEQSTQPDDASSGTFSLEVPLKGNKSLFDVISPTYEVREESIGGLLGGLMGARSVDHSGYSVAPIRTAPPDDTLPVSKPSKIDGQSGA